MPKEPVYYKYQRRVQVAVGHDPCRTQAEGGYLGQKKSNDGTENGEIEYPIPYLVTDALPLNGRETAAAENHKPDAAGHQHPESHDRHGFTPMQQFDKRGIGSHEQAAVKKYQVTTAQLQVEQSLKITLENNPQGTGHGKKQGHETVTAKSFSQYNRTVNSRNTRYQRKNYTGVQGGCRTQ